MFTKIFNKPSFGGSLIVLLIFCGALYNHYNTILVNPEEKSILNLAIIIIFPSVSLVLVKKIIRDQLFSKKSSYHLLLFSLFFWLLPFKNWDAWIWIPTLIFWVSFLPILKLEPQNLSKENIFNTSFWLFFTVLFKVDFIYFYLSLWLLLYIRRQLDYKRFFLTILPPICILIIWYTLCLLIPSFPNISSLSFTPLKFPFLWNENHLINNKLVFILISSLIIFIGVFIGKNTNNDLYKRSVSYSLLMLFTSIMLLFFGGPENFTVWVSFLTSIAILSAFFFNNISRKWIIELFFILCVGMIFQDNILFLFRN